MQSPEVQQSPVVYWYRFEDKKYAPPVDEFDNPCGASRLTVNLYRFKVIKTTPKGVWIEGWGAKRFILRDARKRYACPTIDEAKESFIARKARQAAIHQGAVDRATTAARMVTENRYDVCYPDYSHN